MEKIGLIPAAGFAKRIAPLPCSKEIYPLGFRFSDDGKEPCLRVACHGLLESMATAGAETAYMILRPEKWDIPSYLCGGTSTGLKLAYLIVEKTSGAPFTVDHAYPFVKDALILFGFPDIIFGPEDAFKRMAAHQQVSKADIVLGLFRAGRPHKMDMVELDAAGRVRDIVIKPRATDLVYTWIIAVWTKVFSEFMHIFLSRRQPDDDGRGGELYMGDVILAGLHEGLTVETVVFDDGHYMDIGTPEDLTGAVKENIQAIGDSII
jgi:glucose-1-phosphate thymidylyltransferase